MIVIQRSCCVCLPKASACNTSVVTSDPSLQDWAVTSGEASGQREHRSVPPDRHSLRWEPWRGETQLFTRCPPSELTKNGLFKLINMEKWLKIPNIHITEEQVREQKLYRPHLLLQRGGSSSKPSMSPCSNF